MSKTKKNLIAFSVTSTVCLAVLYHEILIHDLMTRFPHIPTKVLRKSFHIFLKDAFTGKYADIDISTDELCDKVFLKEVQNHM